MGIFEELSSLSNDDEVTVTHIKEFRRQHNTCTSCLKQNNNQVTVDKCLSCPFYKEKVLHKNDDIRISRKLVSFFYSRHPIKSLVPNKVRDCNVMKRCLEYLDPNQIVVALKYMHTHLIPDINQVHYIYNQALFEIQVQEDLLIEGSSSNLLQRFYKERKFSLTSPNLQKEIALVHQCITTYSSDTTKLILDYMRDNNHTDLRLFNYMRNEYLNRINKDTSNTDFVDETEDLI